MKNLSDLLEKYDRVARTKIVRFRGLSKANLVFLLEHSNPANVSVHWLGKGDHSLMITCQGLVSNWNDCPIFDGISFEEFQRQVNSQILLESQHDYDQCLVNDWQERLASKRG